MFFLSQNKVMSFLETTSMCYSPQDKYVTDCGIVCVLSYLGMNLLVFLQDIPVTERGWAK